MPEPGMIALDLTCAECGRSPRSRETWRILLADKVAREAVTYCPECAEREFGDNASRKQPDYFVAFLAYLLGEAQAFVSWPAYTPLSRRWTKPGRPRLYFNYAYAAGWAALLVLLIALSYAFPSLRTFCAVVATWRFAEIAIWYVKLLFDSTHSLILSAERNLLFLTIDALATVAIVWLWLSAASVTGPSNPSDLSEAVTTFTLNGAPPGYDGWQASVATIVGTLGGIVLIGAGLALLVGLVGERFHYGTAEGYTGPVRHPRPRWKDYQPREGSGSEE